MCCLWWTTLIVLIGLNTDIALLIQSSWFVMQDVWRVNINSSDQIIHVQFGTRWTVTKPKDFLVHFNYRHGCFQQIHLCFSGTGKVDGLSMSTLAATVERIRFLYTSQVSIFHREIFIVLAAVIVHVCIMYSYYI